MTATELFFVRLFAYSILPLLLATGHMVFDKQARTRARRIELFLVYLFAISVGASGLGSAFGHLLLSDTVAASIGWEAGSPFQLEMGFANLAIGVLGIGAIAQRGGFRRATILATTIIGVGATIVHLQDIIFYGNLAPGNTIQNVANLLDPVLLIVLLAMARGTAETKSFLNWQMRLQPIAGWAAAGVGTGFGIDFAVGVPLVFTIIGTLVGVGIGYSINRQIPRVVEERVGEAV